MSTRKLTQEEVSILFPIRNLPDESKVNLIDRVPAEILPRGSCLFEQGNTDSLMLYLLDGEIELRSDASREIIRAGSTEARFPIANKQPRPATVTIISPQATLLRFEKTIVDSLQDQDLTSDIVVDDFDVDGSPVDNKLYFECFRDMQNEDLTLPSLPDIALKIRKAIEDESANSHKIAQVIQIDPAFTVRLIHIANSPLHRGRKKIESCPEAITRLGLKAVRDLIISFSLKAVFNAKSPLIKRRMHELWSHSSLVAAICAVLAKKTPGFDPDKAMLAGLTHDIGIIPILTHADSHPELISNPKDLDQAIAHLRGQIGTLIMQKWDFPPDFLEITQEAENWNRDIQEKPDYTDLVIVSQLHSMVGTPKIHKLPRMDELPAYHKLAAGELNAGLSLKILDEARDEIRQVQQLLTG